jgi:hypothetical protein
VAAYDGEASHLAIVRDITARKMKWVRAQEQLLENLLAVARTMYEQPTVQATLQNALEIALALTAPPAILLLDSSGAVTHSVLSSARQCGAAGQRRHPVDGLGLAGLGRPTAGRFDSRHAPG